MQIHIILAHVDFVHTSSEITWEERLVSEACAALYDRDTYQ